VSDKLGVIGNLLGLADRVLIGGGMVYTFLAALGHEVGTSLLETDHVESCKEILGRAAGRGVELVLLTDIVVAPRFTADAIPEGHMGGLASRELFASKLADARTVFWNGPMGVFEFPAALSEPSRRSSLGALQRGGGLFPATG
jgi:phosphoglycerate kinase